MARNCLKGQVPKFDPTITIAPGFTDEVEETVHAVHVLSRINDYGRRKLVRILRWTVRLMKHIPGSTAGSYLGVKSSSLFIVPDSSACSSEFNPEIAAILSWIAYREGIRYVPRILVPPACAFVVFVSDCPSTV